MQSWFRLEVWSAQKDELKLAARDGFLEGRGPALGVKRCVSFIQTKQDKALVRKLRDAWGSLTFRSRTDPWLWCGTVAELTNIGFVPIWYDLRSQKR